MDDLVPPKTANPLLRLINTKTHNRNHRMKKQYTSRAVFALTAALLLSPFASLVAQDQPAAPPAPAIELGSPFRDNAILQREMPLPVWGWSKPGTTVTVEFAGQKESTKAGDNGKWMLQLKPLTASAEPAEMVVQESGKKVVLKNILVGEVWMASGQSNMKWIADKCDVKGIVADLKAKGESPPIREFEVTSAYSALHPIERATGAWKEKDYGNYSAVAFAFAHKLYGEIKVPIGILNCSWSETSIEAWTPREGYASAQDDYGKSIHQQCLITDPRTPEHKQAWDGFYKSLEQQITASQQLVKSGVKPPPISAPPPGNMKGNRDANWMFNGRMNPVVPYAIRGAIWNQGWANRHSGLLYYNCLHNMIRGWRLVWDKPELPVYFHQFYCPGNDKFTGKPSLDSTAEMRLATWLARDIPHTGMASQIDIQGAIHYGNKTLPGKRLALHALKNQYGKNIVADSPMFQSYEVKGDQLIVSFDFAEGGLLVGQPNEKDLLDAPAVLENSEDKVKLFYLAGEDRVWHPATMKIEGGKIVVKSPGVKAPHGISYGAEGIGFQPNLYNKAMLPLIPFMMFDNKLVTSKDWPGGKIVIANEKIDTSKDGKVYEYRKMPLLSQQFDDNAVLQAGKPVTIWGATRNYGEWQVEPEKGDCKVEFEFGDIKKTIAVTPDMKEWQVTLPAMKAGTTPYTLKVRFTIDGEIVHQREAKNIIFGDVWYLALPDGKFTAPEVKPSGQIVRMIENESKRDGNGLPSRFSIATSRGLKAENRFASYWKDAEGLAAFFGHGIAAKTKNPVGIIFMQSKSEMALSNWIAADFLNQAPSLMADYKTVGSQHTDNPHYLENIRRYIADWQKYWNSYIPTMIETKAAPDGAQWGVIPKLAPDIGDSQATQTYNVYVDCFSPGQVSGVVFLCGNKMITDAEGANFGPEMSALANCFKAKFGGDDVPFFYTLPTAALAPKITKPQAIKGTSTALEINELAAAKPVDKSKAKAEQEAASARVAALLEKVAQDPSASKP
jgi:sialate O-acetylesterase